MPGVLRRLSPARLYDLRRARRAKADAEAWRRSGGGGPLPALEKHRLLRRYAEDFSLAVLVETGTYLGDTVAALRGSFRRVYSIEVDDALHRRAQARFAGLDDVELVHGDSGRELPRVLARMHEPALFWLDGHYSGGITGRGAEVSPIVAELQAVFAHPVGGHVILVDDARCFDGTGGWPTIDDLRRLVERHDPSLEFAVENDVIRIHGRREGR